MAKRQITYTLKKSWYDKQNNIKDWYVYKSGKKHKHVARLKEGIGYIRNRAFNLLKQGKVKKVIFKRYTSDDKLQYVREITRDEKERKINMKKIKG